MSRKTIIAILAVCMLLLFAGCSVLDIEDRPSEQTQADPLTAEPLGGLLGNRTDTVHIIIMLTVMTILPSFLLMMTGFTRIVIVLGIIKNAMGLKDNLPKQVIVGLALFLALFLMAPVIGEIKKDAYEPYITNKISQKEAMERGIKPVRAFMMRNIYEADFELFINLSNRDKPEDQWITEPEQAPNTLVMAAFATSEIKRAFQMGFYLYLPFIVIDLIVASVLMSMGMMMVPPASVSLPFKILLFILVNGWMLTVQSLITSFS